MPAVATLDDLTAMIAADPHGHHYELSPDGVLSIMPPADGGHALIPAGLATRHERAAGGRDRVAQLSRWSTRRPSRRGTQPPASRSTGRLTGTRHRP
jgi:hypothetical protein